MRKLGIVLFAVLISVFCFGNAHSDLGEGLVAHYPFNGNANDESGNENHATAFNDYSYETGIVGDAIHLVGSGHTGLGGGHVLLPTFPLNTMDEFTIAIWVKFQGITSWYGDSFIHFGRSTYNNSIYGMFISEEKTEGIRTGWRIGYYGGGPWPTAGVSGVHTYVSLDFENNWHHHVLRIDNGVLTGFMDGQSLGSVSYTKPTNPLEDVAGIGVHFFNSGGTESNRFIGSIDDTRIYDRALTDDEVWELSQENTDTDDDGISGGIDNCPNEYNPNQEDNDIDGIGDVCDPDDDNDGILDPSDNCPTIPNPGQEDNDQDGVGDVGDSDDDNDGVNDEVDNCPFTSNADQSDIDGDTLGDVCDDDPDGDGVLSGDNCPYTPNEFQEDNDLDGEGDVCDADDDNDGVLDEDDNCDLTSNEDQADLDQDNIGDACDIDIDGDGIENLDDNCPLIANTSQDDTDYDGLGDSCDLDDDNDGVLDVDDNCSLMVNPDQDDTDGDGQGDVCDGDLDGDGMPNEIDNCPTTPNSEQNDFDQDGIGDACDPDIDDDGVENTSDECEFTPFGEIVDPSNGCSIDQLVPCEGPRGINEVWKNHGKYVSTIAHTANNFLKEGLITEEEKEAIMDEAATSICGQ